MAAKSGENCNFSPFYRTLLYFAEGQKFARNRCISYGFRDIDTFSLSAKIQDDRQKSYTTLWVIKFAQNGSLCYGFRDIDTFSFSAKI